MLTQVQVSLRISKGEDQRIKFSHHIIVKRLTMENQGTILKTTREKYSITFKGKPIRITADFSAGGLRMRHLNL